MKKILTSIIFTLSLSGCGGLGPGDFSPSPGSSSPPPRVDIQFINQDPTDVTAADWVSSAESINRQLQNEFLQDWGVNCVLVPTNPTLLDNAKPALFGLDALPDPSKSNNVGGYHLGRQAYVRCSPGYAWGLANSHEVMELICDEGVNTAWNNLLINLGALFGSLPTEICDACEAFGYDVSPSGVITNYNLNIDAVSNLHPSCSDYCTPYYFGIGSPTYFVDGRIRYDFMGILTSAGEIGPGGSKPVNHHL